MAIENFEQITEDLTDRELDFLPDVQEAIKNALEKAIEPRKQNELITLINSYLQEKHGLFCSLSLSGVRLRKYVNYLRSNSILPIIGTSSGYSIANKKDIIESQIKSLKQRARQINRAAEGLQKYLLTIKQ